MDLTHVPGVLGEIGRKSQLRVEAFRRKYDETYLEQRRIPSFKPKDFAGHMSSGTWPRIIAEIKRASPSAGSIAAHSHPVHVAEDYLRNGAHALSVLTEPDYFSGDINFLRKIRERFPDAFLLMKDFFVEPFQFQQALWAGADCVLIIIALLGEDNSREMVACARNLGLSVLIEVHNQAELDVALSVDTTLIGINNRNLKDLSISLDVAATLAPRTRPDSVVIGESGITNGRDIVRLTNAGCDGFLVGSHFMTHENNDTPYSTPQSSPGKKLQDLILDAQVEAK